MTPSIERILIPSNRRHIELHLSRLNTCTEIRKPPHSFSEVTALAEVFFGWPCHSRLASAVSVPVVCPKVVSLWCTVISECAALSLSVLGATKSSSSTQSQLSRWEGTHSDPLLGVYVCRMLILRGSSLNNALHMNSSGVLFIWRMRRQTCLMYPIFTGCLFLSYQVFKQSPCALTRSCEVYGWKNNELCISFILHHLKYNFSLKTV